MIAQKKSCSRGVSARSVLGGLLVGGLVGSGIVLLKAPRSGEDTRKLIRDKADELQSKTEQTFNDTQSRVENITEQLSDKAAEIKASGMKAAKEVEKQAHNVAETVTAS